MIPIIPLTHAIAKCFNFRYGRKKGSFLYSLLLEHSKLVLVDIQTNFNCFGNNSIDIRNGLHHLEGEIFDKSILTYYLKSPSDTASEREYCIPYKQFLKDSSSFYEGGGSFICNSNGRLEVFLDVKILDCFKRVDKEHTLFANNGHSNPETIYANLLFVRLKENSEKIFKSYKKNYRDLTRDEFRDCLKEILNEKVPQHIADLVWYGSRNPPKK